MSEKDYEKFRINHKTFLAALATFASNKQKFKRYYNDKRLTHQEKQLLKARIALRNCKHAEGLEMLEITPQNEYLKAHWAFLKGSFHNNFTQYELAAPLLKQAFMLFHKIGDPKFTFQSLYSLTLVIYNMRITSQMEYYLKELKKLRVEDPFQKSCILRVESLYLSLIDNNNEALVKINEALTIKSDSLEDQISLFLVSKFVILFKLNRYAECEEIFRTYKDSNGFAGTANYNFMKKMLDHFLHDTPLYAYQKHFKDAPELEYQVNVIKHLSCGEFDLAEMWWSKLNDMIPSLYGDNFLYRGDYCLFSACLAKHLRPKVTNNFNLEQFQGSI